MTFPNSNLKDHESSKFEASRCLLHGCHGSVQSPLAICEGDPGVKGSGLLGLGFKVVVLLVFESSSRKGFRLQCGLLLFGQRLRCGGLFCSSH